MRQALRHGTVFPPGNSRQLNANARDMFDHARPDLDQALTERRELAAGERVRRWVLDVNRDVDRLAAVRQLVTLDHVQLFGVGVRYGSTNVLVACRSCPPPVSPFRSGRPSRSAAAHSRNSFRTW